MHNEIWHSVSSLLRLEKCTENKEERNSQWSGRNAEFTDRTVLLSVISAFLPDHWQFPYFIEIFFLYIIHFSLKIFYWNVLITNFIFIPLLEILQVDILLPLIKSCNYSLSFHPINAKVVSSFLTENILTMNSRLIHENVRWVRKIISRRNERNNVNESMNEN